MIYFGKEGSYYYGWVPPEPRRRSFLRSPGRPSAATIALAAASSEAGTKPVDDRPSCGGESESAGWRGCSGSLLGTSIYGAIDDGWESWSLFEIDNSHCPCFAFIRGECLVIVLHVLIFSCLICDWGRFVILLLIVLFFLFILFFYLFLFFTFFFYFRRWRRWNRRGISVSGTFGSRSQNGARTASVFLWHWMGAIGWFNTMLPSCLASSCSLILQNLLLNEG